MLTVESLQPEDEGQLQCTMVLGAKTVRSKPCQLVMIGIVQPPINTDVLIGASARLYCIATGVYRTFEESILSAVLFALFRYFALCPSNEL